MKKHFFISSIMACLLSSCCIVRTGEVVENIGKSIPIDTRLISCHPRPQGHKKYEYTVYTRGNTSYVEVEVKYQTARTKWLKTNVRYLYLSTEHRPLFYEDCHSKHEKDGIYYAVFTRSKYRPSITEGTAEMLIPQHEFNPKGCSRSVVTLPYSAQKSIWRHLPESTAWYNTALLPLSWVAYVADIPLSYVASPFYAIFAPMGINCEYP